MHQARGHSGLPGVSPVQTQTGDIVSGPSKGLLSHGSHCTSRHIAPRGSRFLHYKWLEHTWVNSPPVLHSQYQGRKPLSRAITPSEAKAVEGDTLHQ